MPRERNVELAIAMGNRIAKRRRELGLTQAQAADIAGLSQQFYACAERGMKVIGSDSVLKVCSALDISADYLIKGAMSPDESAYFMKLLTPMNESQRHAAEEIIKNLLMACGYDVPEK